MSLLQLQDAGRIHSLKRQVQFPLMTRNPAGLMEVVTRYIADFTYMELAPADQETWRLVVEDVKPSGGLREDAYLLKKKWFEAQHGTPIRETH